MKAPYLLLLLLGSILTGCVTGEPSPPALSKGEALRKLPPATRDKDAWTDAILGALSVIDKDPTAERVCAVVAVIEQESGFQANPTVKNLPKIVRAELAAKFSRLGPLAEPAVAAILKTRQPGTTETFGQRIDKLRTEQDLDRFFRDLVSRLRDRFPGSIMLASAVSKAMGKGWLDDLNPVTTAGSMQVKVSFAKEVDGFKGLEDDMQRDLLYTIVGGVRAGTARLLQYEASYDDVIYRFADYNAGVYASRNAAFQVMLGSLTGIKLVPDGDLLAYDQDGGPSGEESQSLKAMRAFARAHDLSDWSVHRGANTEKEDDFESSTMWEEVREAYGKKTGKPPVYARIPAVAITSPKLAGPRSTEWFAKNVKRRYTACRAR